MRKIVIIISLLLSLFAFNILSAQEVVTQDVDTLHQKAQAFIKKHFFEEKIASLRITKERPKVYYEVTLTSGMKIKFSKNGTWEVIVCNNSTIPNGIIPARIFKYINQEELYKNSSIISISKREEWRGKKLRTYEVEMSRSIGSIFNKRGKCIAFILYDYYNYPEE